MNSTQAWQSVLSQLQAEMPKASFETWVRDTQAIGFDGKALTVGVRNAYARDWLEARLAGMVSGLLSEIMNQSVAVCFVVVKTEAEDEPEDNREESEPDENLVIEPVQWLDYDRIVQPHRQVVVKGYLRRLAMETGPKAIWLYIGFHQAAWMTHALGNSIPIRSREVMRFSGLSFGAFWRLLKQPAILDSLSGLVERLDPPEARHYRRGRDGRPHRAPVCYRVSMTPRLTRMDAAAIHARLHAFLERGATLAEGLRELLAGEEVLGLLLPPDEITPIETPCNTVMEIARHILGNPLTPEVEQLAQELQRKIVNCLGDIHLTHYFITQVIPQYNLTPAQAWLVTVARDMAYINWRTGERREIVAFKGGYREMAALVGSNRPKTIQAWFHPEWESEQRGGDLTRFLQEQEIPDRSYADLRTDTMPRTFRVLLDEPLDADGSHMPGANGRNTLGADGSHSQPQMEAIAGANGSHMAGANGSDLNTYQHLKNTYQEITSTPQHAETEAAKAVPDFWELRTLLEQNEVHPKVQRELLESEASVEALVSWVLYAASPKSGRLSDPLGYALSRLREHPLRGAHGIFGQLASLPPVELLGLIDSTPTGGYRLFPPYPHPLAPAWKQAMGSPNRLLVAVRQILFGQGDPD